MPSKYGNKPFYDSKKWRSVSAAYMSSKNYMCERCGKPASICHHKKWLNSSNVHDPETALDFSNLEALCLDCHNAEHGAKHDITSFDEAGNVAQVRETEDKKIYRQNRSQIDDLVEKARELLSVVSCDEE